MLRAQRRLMVWVGLLALSTLVHAVVSWRIGRQIEPIEALPPPEEVVQIVMEQPPEELLEKPEPPEEQLEFEEELELEPPEILIAPKAVAPPPPDVSVALKAQSGGFEGIEIESGLAAVPLSEGSGIGGFKTGIGNGLGDGTARFAAYVAGLRASGLDVVFVIDATGSMDWVIEEVKDRIEDISQIVRSLVPIARFGFVAYRDRDDPEFTTRVQPLTYSTAKLYRFLSRLEAKGGGDWFEAVDAGLRSAIEESGWRLGARKLIIVVGDAPMKDDQVNQVVRLVNQFRRAGGTVSTLDVSDQANPHLLEAKVGRRVARALYRSAPMQAFLLIGEAGGGDTATLDGELKLTKRLIKLIMGDQFANEMQALLDVL
ncbi:MAG: vWA domain-containing protein [Gammaproteobacteria bacterium]